MVASRSCDRHRGNCTGASDVAPLRSTPVAHRARVCGTHGARCTRILREDRAHPLLHPLRASPARFSALSGISKGAGSARATHAGRKRDTSSPFHPSPRSLPPLPVGDSLVAEGLRFSERGKKRARKRCNYRDRFATGPIYLAPRR